MMNKVVVAGLGLLSVVLLVLFARVLPASVERERVGRDNALKAVCEPALRPSPNEFLGALPVDAPGFALQDYAGREISLSSLKGRVVLVNFWATWCPPCVAEVGSLERLTQLEKNKPFSLLAVSVDDSWDTVRGFFPKGTPLTVLLDSDKKSPARYGTQKFPETFIIDREGKVRFFVVSDRDWAAPDIKACIDALVDEG